MRKIEGDGTLNSQKFQLKAFQWPATATAAALLAPTSVLRPAGLPPPCLSKVL